MSSDDAVQPSGRLALFRSARAVARGSGRVVENHLALCPTCCAKWQHARSTSNSNVIAALQSARELQISVTLADEPVVIRFVQVHLEDLRTIISVTVDTAIPVNSE